MEREIRFQSSGQLCLLPAFTPVAHTDDLFQPPREPGMETAQASQLTTFLFSLVAFLLLAGLHHALGRPGIPVAARRWQFPVILVFGLVLPGWLAWTGQLNSYTPPPPVLLLVAGITAGTVLLARSATGKALADTLPLQWLVGFQGFRILVEYCLHRLSLEGLVPPVMTWSGRNLDVITGLLALPLAWLLAKGRCERRWLLMWNWLGLALLANIVVVAVLATPVPFRLFTDQPVNRLPHTFPFVWLPTVLVQAALLGHLLVFRALKRLDTAASPETAAPAEAGDPEP